MVNKCLPSNLLLGNGMKKLPNKDYTIQIQSIFLFLMRINELMSKPFILSNFSHRVPKFCDSTWISATKNCPWEQWSSQPPVPVQITVTSRKSGAWTVDKLLTTRFAGSNGIKSKTFLIKKLGVFSIRITLQSLVVNPVVASS